MRKPIDYTVEYREEGVQDEIEVRIDFISNRVMKDFSDLMVLANEAETAHSRISDIATIISGEDLTEEKKAELREESNNCIDKIMEFNDNGYFTKRFEILKRILVDNGYKENERLMSLDFWEECVDPAELLKFMYLAIYKDVDKKKKPYKM
jgi:hypothetical protein